MGHESDSLVWLLGNISQPAKLMAAQGRFRGYMFTESVFVQWSSLFVWEVSSEAEGQIAECKGFPSGGC